MGLPAVGDVVLVNFPYADLQTFKKRPALVVAHSSLKTVILCQITSKQLPGVPSLQLLSTDFASGGLALTSYIRPDKLFTVDPASFEHTLGSLKPLVTQNVLQSIQKLFSITGSAR